MELKRGESASREVEWAEKVEKTTPIHLERDGTAQLKAKVSVVVYSWTDGLSKKIEVRIEYGEQV